MISSRKKVLFLIESLAGGGAEKVLSVLVRHLDQEKFDVTVMTVVDTGIHADQVRQKVNYRSLLGAPPTALLPKIWYWFRYKLVYSLPPKLIYQALISEHYDVEVAFIEGFSTKLIAASTAIHSRKLAWVHADLCVNHWTTSIFQNQQQETNAYQRFDRIACVSRKVKESVATNFGLTEQTEVIYNPVDDREIRKRAAETPDEGYPLSHRLRLVSIGRLVEQKGYDRLLKIHRLLMDDGVEHDLWILGEGPQRNQLEAYVRQYQLEGSVLLPGFQMNPHAIMRLCDLFICSSRSEGFSTAVTEALIIGLPVITTDCSGMRELLGENNEFGVVTENSEAALYEGLKTLIVEHDKLTYYRIQAAIRGLDFGLERTMPAIESLLR